MDLKECRDKVYDNQWDTPPWIWDVHEKMLLLD